MTRKMEHGPPARSSSCGKLRTGGPCSEPFQTRTSVPNGKLLRFHDAERHGQGAGIYFQDDETGFFHGELPRDLGVATGYGFPDGGRRHEDPIQHHAKTPAHRVVHVTLSVRGVRFGHPVKSFPTREDITTPIQEQLIVELYSK